MGIMSRPREATTITCQNPDCQYYLTEAGKDVLKNGRNCTGNQQYLCKHCGKYFIETKNTPLYNSRLDRSSVELICKHNMEKTSIRGVERVTGHHRDTVSRYYHLIGEHAEILNEYYLRNIASGQVELDEIWTFVQKKQKL
jgi:transposase-like protein